MHFKLLWLRKKIAVIKINQNHTMQRHNHPMGNNKADDIHDYSNHRWDCSHKLSSNLLLLWYVRLFNKIIHYQSRWSSVDDLRGHAWLCYCYVVLPSWLCCSFPTPLIHWFIHLLLAQGYSGVIVQCIFQFFGFPSVVTPLRKKIRELFTGSAFHSCLHCFGHY